jgi:light-regulated signal transduction histidine kinase (bacteriophytochrome)
MNSITTPNERLAELEALLEKQTAELAEVKRELEDLNYSVSHDLRAPLRHIAGFAQIMAEDHSEQMDPKCRQYLQSVEDGARRMNVLLESLLSLSRIRRQKLTWQPVDTDALVRGIIQDIESKMEGGRVEWKIGNLPYIDCDSSLIKQVFFNLFSNAVKFTRSGSMAVVEVDTMHKDGALVFFIRDNGVGFDMKYADRLFGIFQRLHAQNEFEGIGAGLAIVRQIIQKHCGTIWAESAINRGTTFFFTLNEAPVQKLR